MSALNASAPSWGLRAVVRSGTAPARLLAIEVRRNTLPWMLPVAAALLWFDAIRTAQNYPPVWDQMSAIITGHVMPDVGPFAAGLAAWIGARENRCGLGDLLTTTARPRWIRQLASWAATVAWALLAYAGAVGVIFGMTAARATWGSPYWWPVAVGGGGVALFVTVGFVAGAMFPSRFTAPLAVIGTTMVSVMVFRAAVDNNQAGVVGLSLLSPNSEVPPLDSGVFYPVPADLSILKVMFLVGAIAVGLGALGLSAAGATVVRRIAASVTAAGVVAAGTALVLVSTAHYGPHGVTVSAVHDAGSDRPIAYTPVCTQGPVPVCVHPAFRAELTAVAATFAPVLSTVAGLPGAPVRVDQVDLGASRLAGDNYSVDVTLTDQDGPTLQYAFDDADAFGSGGPDPTALASSAARDYLRTQAASEVLAALLGPPSDANPAAEAVTYGLLSVMGIPTGVNADQAAGSGIGVAGPAAGSDVATAARAFAALPAATRSAWLISHLAALRSGQITLTELP